VGIVSPAYILARGVDGRIPVPRRWPGSGSTISALAIAGIAMEIGIEPTARHAVDLGILPVIIEDAFGAVTPRQRNASARRRALPATPL
jgi:hypothetical protein